MKVRWKLLTFPVLWGAVLSPLHGYAKSPADLTADRIVILKSKRELQLWSKDTLLKKYRVSLGAVPVGRKQQQGNHRTPEGSYVIAGRNVNSRYHRSLRISYPDAAHSARANALGVSPGGDIMIHGLPNG